MEANLDYAEGIFTRVLEGMDKERVLSSEIICAELANIWRNTPIIRHPAQCLSKVGAGLCPGFYRFRIGAGCGQLDDRQAIKQGLSVEAALTSLQLNFNPFQDLGSYGKRILHAKKLGIFTIGGGVPAQLGRNRWPLFDILQNRLNISLPFVRFHYGVRVCPAGSLGRFEWLHL